MSETPTQPFTFSVIICAYTQKRWEDLVAAISSVQRQSRPAHELLVVVDHNPELMALVRERFPEVTLLANDEQRGLSGARNSGIRAATGDILAFLDDDAEAAPDWLEQLGAAYTEPEIIGVGGAIEPRWLAGRPAWFPEEFHWVVGCTYRGMPTRLSPVRNLIGCNMSLRRGTFAAIGGFYSGIGRVDTLPVGCEETELCIRARQRWPEAKMLYKPSAQVLHRVPASRGAWAYFRSRCYAEGLSKAQVARLVGSQAGLSAERSYTLKTLPLGVLRGVGAWLSGDRAGLQRAGAIVAGLALTTAGFLRGSVHLRLQGRSDAVPQLGKLLK